MKKGKRKGSKVRAGPDDIAKRGRRPNTALLGQDVAGSPDDQSGSVDHSGPTPASTPATGPLAELTAGLAVNPFPSVEPPQDSDSSVQGPTPRLRSSSRTGRARAPSKSAAAPTKEKGTAAPVKRKHARMPDSALMPPPPLPAPKLSLQAPQPIHNARSAPPLLNRMAERPEYASPIFMQPKHEHDSSEDFGGDLDDLPTNFEDDDVDIESLESSPPPVQRLMRGKAREFVKSALTAADAQNDEKCEFFSILLNCDLLIYSLSIPSV